METIIGWKLDPDQRAELLLQFPPVYPLIIADHVTLRRTAAAQPLPDDAEAEIVGRTDDGAGVEAMIVRLNGSTDRPDGSTWHITWSLAGERTARESNEVIAALGWTPIDLPMPLILKPARWPWAMDRRAAVRSSRPSAASRFSAHPPWPDP